MNCTKVRIATYNIHAAVGMDRRFEPARVAAVLHELDADVVGLQEVEHHQVGDLDLLDHLAAQCNYKAIAGPTLLRGDRHYGNALLTRLPVAKLDRVDLTLPGREARGAIDVVLDEANQTRIIVTHLGLRPYERRRQIEHLLEQIESGDTDARLILMGDLNEWLTWGRPLRWLHRWFEATPAPATFPSPLPLVALDRIWVHPRNALLEISAHNTATARRASDHLPLVAELA
ncbi:MAG: endonuclease/exonuclease/phosphatase family protein [Gammaproteobacteria bacterium]|nr:endonuclease/exonuclease/phosphatase family protein [Gammaproteobacteria bacterium]